ncbi:MAG: DsbA family protein [Aeromicrobium erythreum]
MTTVRVDLWTDLGCPWSYVARARLERGFEEAATGATLDLRLHSFELNPGSRTTTISIPEIWVKKHGGTRDDALAAESRVAGLAAEMGLPFTIDRLASNTHDVLRVLQLATTKDLAATWFAQLQRGYFGGTVNPFERAELVASAVAGGMDADEVADVLDHARFEDEIERDRDAALARGARGVPFLVVDDRIVHAGVVSVAEYARTFASLGVTS